MACVGWTLLILAILLDDKVLCKNMIIHPGMMPSDLPAPPSDIYPQWQPLSHHMRNDYDGNFATTPSVMDMAPYERKFKPRAPVRRNFGIIKREDQHQILNLAIQLPEKGAKENDTFSLVTGCYGNSCFFRLLFGKGTTPFTPYKRRMNDQNYNKKKKHKCLQSLSNYQPQRPSYDGKVKVYEKPKPPIKEYRRGEKLGYYVKPAYDSTERQFTRWYEYGQNIQKPMDYKKYFNEIINENSVPKNSQPRQRHMNNNNYYQYTTMTFEFDDGTNQESQDAQVIAVADRVRGQGYPADRNIKTKSHKIPIDEENNQLSTQKRWYYHHKDDKLITESSFNNIADRRGQYADEQYGFPKSFIFQNIIGQHVKPLKRKKPKGRDSYHLTTNNPVQPMNFRPRLHRKHKHNHNRIMDRNIELNNIQTAVVDGNLDPEEYYNLHR